MFNKLLLAATLLLITISSHSQIQYENISNKNLSLGSYGRVGVDWSFAEGASIGRRMNLNNMGSVGGRMEEQDYLELVPALHFKPFDDDDETEINVQMRFSVFSRSLANMSYETTSTPGGLTIGLPELYVEGKNIGGSGVNVWVGARVYRGKDVHIADHFYFNDHSGQGFGVEYKQSRMGALFIASSDTTSNLPPYFYLNIATGTPSTGLRQRIKFFYEHDFKLSDSQTLTGLAEFHYMGDGAFDAESDTSVVYQYPADWGYVLGARLSSKFDLWEDFSSNLALRLGKGIANGGDGGVSRTYMTFGAPDLEKRNFKDAYSFSLVEDIFIRFNDTHSLSAYLIYTNSRGAGKTNGLEYTYYGREVYNKKEDFAIGLRESFVITDYFKLLTDLHYTQRKDGDNPWASVVKVGFSPTLTPTGDRDFWARPEIRFVTSFAFYNQYAANTQYSPYLDAVGSTKFGHYLGIKAEWWLWH